jgi:glycosyltransferase involved in cell wall biosynthesis
LRVLVFHGYLLHGTGSNVYNAELAAALVRAGHEVHLLCQERDPFDLDWVDAAGDWDGGRLAVVQRRDPVRATVYRPHIGGVLPVYVADGYEGIQARLFGELTDAEVEFYLARNVAAVREVAERARPDVALANHLVMGPAVLARALGPLGIPYAVKIHGSALEYTVKPHPERFLGHAREGLAGARGVLVGSRHTGESLWTALDDPALPERTRLGPPGVDVRRFSPRGRENALAGLERLRARLAGTAPDGTPGSSFARDPAEAVRALETLTPEDRLVVFVGKLIGSKGVELLLAAWPLVVARVPAARLLVVGFGAFREGAERLAADIARGDLEAIAGTRNESGAQLLHLTSFARQAPDGYAEAGAASADRVTFAGRLDHEELAELLPAAEAMVVPSTFPESFGMVAAEAAACGVLPVVAAHSGLAEVSRELAAVAPPEAADWLSFEVGPDAVTSIAAALVGWLEAPEGLRARTREAIVGRTRELWSWEGVARTVVAAAEGRLDEVPEP